MSKILYEGQRAVLNFSKSLSIEHRKVSKGEKRGSLSLDDFDGRSMPSDRKYRTEIVFMHRLDLNSVMNITKLPCVVLTDTMEQSEILRILKCDGIKGVSGLFISRLDMDFKEFKEICADAGIKMTSFESILDFSEF